MRRSSSSSSSKKVVKVEEPKSFSARNGIALAPGDDSSCAWSAPPQSQQSVPAYSKKFGYAPQLSEPIHKELFEKAQGPMDSSSSGAPVSEAGMVLCRVNYNGIADGGLKGLFHTQGADMDVEVRSVQMPDLIAHGPEDRDWMPFAIPLVSPSAKGPWKAKVFDRDGDGSREFLGELQIPSAFPSTIEKKPTVIQCRFVPQKDVEERFAKELGEVDQGINKFLEDIKLNPADTSFGLERYQTVLGQHVSRLAAFVGWADARVVRRVQWTEQIMQALRNERAAFVKEQASKSPRSAKFEFGRGEYSASVQSFDCRPEALLPYRKEIESQHREKDTRRIPGCILTLQVTNLGGETLGVDLDDELGWKAMAVREDGQGFSAELLTMQGPEIDTSKGRPSLSPGAKGTLVLGFVSEADGGSGNRPILLHMNPFMADGPVFLALQPKAP